MLKKADHADMIDTCQGKLSSCNAEIEQARLAIQSAQSELQQIEQRRATRQREREQLMPQVQAAYRQLEEARAYAGIATGPQAAIAVTQHEVEAKTSQERYATLQKRNQEAEQSDSARAAELQKTIRQAQTSLPSLEARFQALAATREKLLQEQGESLYGTLSTKLRDAETRERDAHSEAIRAQVVLAQTRAEAIEQLGRWPALKEQLMREHQVYDDASTKALTAYIGLLDILLQERASIDNTPVAKPIGTRSFLQEMIIRQEDLSALANGYPSSLKEKRERIASLLRQYQAALGR
jgi:hypothetical protein